MYDISMALGLFFQGDSTGIYAVNPANGQLNIAVTFSGPAATAFTFNPAAPYTVIFSAFPQLTPPPAHAPKLLEPSLSRPFPRTHGVLCFLAGIQVANLIRHL